MNKNRSTLGFFKYLIKQDGLKDLQDKFHQIATSKMLMDGRKEYNRDEDFYYVFLEHPITMELSEESYLKSFDAELKITLEQEYIKAQNVIDLQLDKRDQVGSMEKYLRSIHKELVGLIHLVNENDKLKKYSFIDITLNKLLNFVTEKLKLYEFKTPSHDTPRTSFKRRRYRNPPDQDKLVKVVRDLITKNIYLNNKTGKPKPTTIAKAILDREGYFGLNIPLTKRRFTDRVKDAIAEIEYHDVDSTS